MPKGFMRKYQKHILFFIVVPILVIFGVGSSIYYMFIPKGRAGPGDVAGSMQIVPGEKIDVTYKDYRRYWRRYVAFNRIWNLISKGDWNWNANEGQVWEHIIRVKAAELAGVEVTDSEVANRMYGIFGMEVTNETLLNILSRLGLSTHGITPKEFVHGVRDCLLAEKFVGFEVGQMKYDSQSLWNEFQDKNGDFIFDYITFKTEDYEKEWSPVDIKQEELEEFWKDPKNEKVLEKFKEERKISYELVMVDQKKLEPSQIDALLSGIEVSEEEMRRAYEEVRNQDRWLKREEKKGGEVPEEEKKEGEAEGGGEKNQRMTFEEAKDELRRECGLIRVLGNILEEGRISEDPGFLREKGRTLGMVYFASPGLQTRVEVENQEILKNIQSEGIPLGEAIWMHADPAEKEAPVVWCREVFQGEGNGRTLCVFRIVENRPSRIPPLEKIESELRREIIRLKAIEAAHQVSSDFAQQVWRRAKVAHKKEKEEIEKKWTEEAKRQIRAMSLRDPAAQKKARESSKQRAEAEFEEVWRSGCGNFFDALAEEKGLKVRRVSAILRHTELFPKIAHCGPLSYSDVNVASRKHLPLMREGEVGGGYASTESREFYVVKVVEKKKPTFSQVTQADIDLLKREKFYNYRVAQELHWNSSRIRDEVRLELTTQEKRD